MRKTKSCAGIEHKVVTHRRADDVISQSGIDSRKQPAKSLAVVLFEAEVLHVSVLPAVRDHLVPHPPSHRCRDSLPDLFVLWVGVLGGVKGDVKSVGAVSQ